jgi:hypothetical protein
MMTGLPSYLGLIRLWRRTQSLAKRTALLSLELALLALLAHGKLEDVLTTLRTLRDASVLCELDALAFAALGAFAKFPRMHAAFRAGAALALHGVHRVELVRGGFPRKALRRQPHRIEWGEALGALIWRDVRFEQPPFDKEEWASWGCWARWFEVCLTLSLLPYLSSQLWPQVGHPRRTSSPAALGLTMAAWNPAGGN